MGATVMPKDWTFFWRDNKAVKNLEYWLSYGFLDTEREALNFPASATPNFATRHNLSVVGKYFVAPWRSQLGASYTFASGRPYNDPNQAEFQGSSTRPFHNLSLNWAYLLSPQKILYFSVNNALGFKNVNTYEFADMPNAEGIFEGRAVRPTADTFFFVGFFWTISSDKKSNQLNTL